MSADKLDSWLEQRLAEPEPYLDDDGFTEAVMARLPAPVSRRRLIWANVVVAVIVSLAVALVFPWASAVALLTSLEAQSWLVLAAGVSGVFTAVILVGGFWGYRRWS
ncbi:DUF5056 domain-containing protein [Gilvimarinus agarilyticus]|uniref:DUF5056 domain-containing protein n=1 Tax=Gilvimarinus agarilyticus TaxID=679259 RepID=UPI00059F30A0|nr:DUF5056 domain-containing protein [Gilvimarinus agarilyticus]